MDTSQALRIVVNRLTDMYQVGMANAGLSEQEINEVNTQVAILQLKDMLGISKITEPVS